MARLVLLLFTLLALSNLTSTAQGRKCATMRNLQLHIARDPSILVQMERSKSQARERLAAPVFSPTAGQTIIIPVVVHVIWHRNIENISDEQIYSQIDILNKDFRLKNSDSLSKTHPFWPNIADANVEFCLANRDPNGKATTGITRTKTDTIAFFGIGSEKRTAKGGIDNWNSDNYLNLWVCNLDGSGDGTLGYASFPFERATAPKDDGVVIDYRVFGNTGTVIPPNALGRTATHEVGHWMNLSHIWGDNQPECGDDDVLDTPPADEPNYDCPSFPHDPNSDCDTDANGEMYMNYMDYVDDACMNMFTKGQVARMQSSLKNERPGLFTSLGCSGTSGVNEEISDHSFAVYPNPTNGAFTVNFRNSTPGRTSISLLNLLGESVFSLASVVGNTTQINIPEAVSGVYYLQIQSGNSTITQRVVITK